MTKKYTNRRCKKNVKLTFVVFFRLYSPYKTDNALFRSQVQEPLPNYPTLSTEGGVLLSQQTP